VVAVLLLIPKTARLGAELIVAWMTAVILSHIFVLGYGCFFVDALMLMVLAVIYLLLTRRHSLWGEPESVGTMAALQTHKNSRAKANNPITLTTPVLSIVARLHQLSGGGRDEERFCFSYCSLAYSALASFRMGMSGSASFHFAIRS
jgi:hypothetical protein